MSLVSEEDKSVLDKIVSPTQGITIMISLMQLMMHMLQFFTAQHPVKSFSYSKLPQKHLALMLKAANKDAQRMRKVDRIQQMLKKGPHFLPTTRSS